jgi:hypothetical protein
LIESPAPARRINTTVKQGFHPPGEGSVIAHAGDLQALALPARTWAMTALGTIALVLCAKWGTDLAAVSGLIMYYAMA